jgi:2,3-dihydro-2,3-dihydroxybenzoate dehydrogenase
VINALQDVLGLSGGKHMSYEGQAIAVTGAANGIGLETARMLAARGASVALIDLDSVALASAAQLFSESNHQAVMTIAADTADTDAMENAIAEVLRRFGRLDALVANAGIRMHSTPIVELEDEIWDRVIRVNLRGVFVSCRAAARPMIEKKAGCIVVVASISGHAVRIGQSAYCASKAGAIQLGRVFALELAEHRIRVNTVCPGTVNTAMFKLAQAQDGPQVLQERIYGSASRFRPGIPLRQIAEPEDVASAIVFLLSSDARHITGQTVFVDGGESIV